MEQSTAKPTARELFRVGQRVRCRLDGRRGVVEGFTLHPGGLVVRVGRLVTVTHMSLWELY